MTIMGINWLNYQETARSNVAREQETSRHNVAGENLANLQFGETVRSNLVNERIKQGSLDESIRSNLVNEGIKQGTLDESKRSNMARENLGFQTLAEDIRSNQAREAENVRSNSAREVELNRSNMARENIDVYRTDIKLLSDVAPLTALYTQDSVKFNPFSVASEMIGNKLWQLVPNVKVNGSLGSLGGAPKTTQPSWGNSGLYPIK